MNDLKLLALGAWALSLWLRSLYWQFICHYRIGSLARAQQASLRLIADGDRLSARARELGV
jgi:hypothetical protein